MQISVTLVADIDLTVCVILKPPITPPEPRV